MAKTVTATADLVLIHTTVYSYDCIKVFKLSRRINNLICVGGPMENRDKRSLEEVLGEYFHSHLKVFKHKCSEGK